MPSIEAWLEELGLGKFAATFAENEVDFEVLPELTEQDLEKIGIPLGPRKKLIKAIALLGADAATGPEPGQPARTGVRAPGPGNADAERRQLTVIFADLVESTALSVRFDPEDLSEIFSQYRACCEQITERYEGTVARYMGDGVLIYFGYPQALELDTERAVRAALELVSGVAELEPLDGVRLQTRVGIATGMVVVGQVIGSGPSEEQSAVGETPHLAARLQSIAEPDTVVISEPTRQLLRGMFECADTGRHMLKGFAEPVQAWRVVGELSVESRFDAGHKGGDLTPLVGREEESELLHRRWQRARTGEGQVVLLSGDAGVGKSRLLQHLRQRLAGDTVTVLRYYGSPYHQSSALYPMIEQLERVSNFARDDTAETKLDKLEATLAKSQNDVRATAPLFAALMSIPTRGRYPERKLSPQRQRDDTVQALIGQLAGFARQGPVLVIFEDLHWVDPTTLELLEQSVDTIPSAPILMVLTFRPDFVPPWVGYPHVTASNLNRLDQAASADFVTKLAGGRDLPRAIVRQILERADGVPLFIEELTKTVLESPVLNDGSHPYAAEGPWPSLAIPSSLQDSLMARLDRLAPVKEVVQIAAVIGRRIDHELIAALSSLDPETLQRALDQIVDTDLLHRRGSPPAAVYTFKHALLQDAVYSTLLHRKRQMLHAEIARVLEARFPDRIQNEPELLAHHYAGAGLHEGAVKYSVKAGKRAVARSAYAEALAHLSAGLESLARLPESTERDHHELRLQTARAAALQATRGFGAAQTGEAYGRARSLCARLHDTAEIFPVLHGAFLFHMLRGEIRLGYDVAEECLRRARTQEELTPMLIALRSLGSALLHLGKIADASDHLTRMLELSEARRHEIPTSIYGLHPLTVAPAFLSLTLYVRGQFERAQALAEDALRHAEALGHPHNLGYALYWINMSALQRQDLDVLRTRAERLRSLGRDEGFLQWHAYGTFQHGVAVAGLGDAEAGIAEIRQGMSDYTATGSVLYLPLMEAQLAAALDRCGQVAEAGAALRSALSRSEQTHELWYAAELHRLSGERSRAVLGDDSAAERAFRQALELALAQGARTWALRAATSLARLQHERGEHRQAHELLAPIYEGFTEGFDEGDLVTARRLLAMLEVA